VELEQEQSDEVQPYEAMVSKIAETGWRERSVGEIEDAQVASDILHELTWQEQEPLERRIGNVRGMLRHLRSRPLSPGRFLSGEELTLLDTLETLEAWAELLGSREAASVAEEMGCVAERGLFEAALFAAMTEFFALVDRLDEPWSV
jgi:hypothetical protein